MSRAHTRPKGRTPAASSPRGSMDEKDAAYIAAANPATLLKLLAVVRLARVVVDAAGMAITDGTAIIVERRIEDMEEALAELDRP